MFNMQFGVCLFFTIKLWYTVWTDFNTTLLVVVDWKFTSVFVAFGKQYNILIILTEKGYWQIKRFQGVLGSM